MKTAGKTILLLTGITILILLTLPLWIHLEHVGLVLEILQWVWGMVALVLLIAMITKLIRLGLQQNRQAPEMMAETLAEAAGEEEASLCAEQLATVLRYGKGYAPCVCFLALTAAHLLMVATNMVMIPVQSFKMPLADITKCTARRSLIVPSQTILTIWFGKEKAKYRLYRRYRKPDDQAVQVERLLARLLPLSR